MTLNFFFFFFILLLRVSAGAEPNYYNSLLPSDAVALLSFKSTADLDNKLLYSLTERYDYCQWRGVKCAQGRVVRLVLSGVGLRGYFSSSTLSRLDQLRVLSLENNSLFGPVPDLSPLVNLKSLFLSRNQFSGAFPPSILSLHRLMILSLSRNNFSGLIPSGINALDRLTSLNLEFNRFNGTLPSMNQSFLTSFNVSGNNLTGVIPVTPTLSRFDASSFRSNPGLCGEIINRACASRSPFFGSSTNKTTSSEAPLGQSAQAQNGGAVVMSPVVTKKKGKESGLVLGFTAGLASLIVLGLCLVVFSLKRNDDGVYEPNPKGDTSSSQQQHQSQIQTPRTTRTVPVTNSDSASQKREKEVQLQATEQLQSRIPNSGSLVFCGESRSQGMYTLEQLMRASAELLGRGSVGITYKAVLDNQLIVTVKRLDATKTAVTSEEAFENHMEIVGGLRHLNLVPIRAYFQSNGERLIIYDYHPNGSLFNLIHGSRSSRAKPLHWTSCLKIAEDVAQGLYYIHQTSSALVHGNLKSTNILLGQDFEACLTDYCLSVLTDSSSASPDDPDSSSYKAPEIRKSSRRPTSKCDVYSFGVLIFELLTGKNASRHPFMAPHDMLDWVRAMRDEEEGTEDNRLGMMTETACLCRVTSPEQRPTMRQVIKMIQEIKESVMAEENDPFR
ncbi:PREDICTED: probable inactive receptor kinase At5g67200 isoform X2 [Camelina sativa]|uniref:Probable inactive receptor kinase At5g67200 isoform X2 n=1 Tax=Camelina sativa TaxID=90675 RepID=A0ABM0XE10_CAMSA|nr:PREDICTED: probable inactive receptor kinase At5g67200 isoform X2 [Camelina sativa]